MKTIKNRILTLLLAGLMAGQTILPVSAAEITDATQGTENTEPGIMLIDEAEPDDGVAEETTGETADVTENDPTAPNTAETVTTDADTVDEASTEAVIEESTEEIDIEPVTDNVDEEIADTTETAEDDVTILSDEVSSNGDISVKVYGVDYFDAEYSSGYLCLSGGTPSGMSTPGDGEYKTSHGTPYKFANTKRSTGVSMTYYNGACMNGVYYDVREYLWIDSANTNCAYVTVIGYTSGSSKNYGSGNTGVYRELHFYKAGTLKSGNPEEVTFRGVLRFRDCDSGEGYNIVQGLQNIWLYPTTNIRRAGTTTWMGTETGEGESEVTTNCFWATVEGTPEEPLTICHVDLGGRSSQINYTGNKIQYNIIANDSNTLPSGVKTSASFGCATYSYYNLIEQEDYNYYEFDGWYYDKEMTNKAPDTVMVSTDMVFYGTYRKVAARVDTEVIGGTITDSIDYIDYGKDATIEYRPNDGYFLDTITVDGETVDPEDYEDSYLFADIHDDHSIKVVYVKAEEPTKSVKFGTDDINGEFVKAGDELTYTITWENPASRSINVTVTDDLPNGITYKSSKTTPTSYDKKTGKIVWDVTAKAGKDLEIVFTATIDTPETLSSAIKNKASVTVNKIVYPTDREKSPVVYVLNPKKTVTKKADPDKDINGALINAGETLVYTISVSNPKDEALAMTITDPLPSYLDFVSTSDDGSEKNGVVTWALKFAAKETKSVTVTVKANDKATGETVKNTARVKAGGTSYDTNEVVNYIIESPKKTVVLDGDKEKTDINGTFVQSGDTLVYTITWKNTSEKDVTATITDDLPKGVTFVKSTPEATVSKTEAGDTLIWKADVKSGKTASITVNVTVDDPKGAAAILKNTASVAVEDVTAKTDTENSPIVYIPAAKKTVANAKSEDIDGRLVSVGDELTYTIHVSNPSENYAIYTITDEIPENAEIVSYSDKTFAKAADGKIVWTYTMAAGDEKDFTVTVKTLKAGVEYFNKATLSVNGKTYATNEVKNWVPKDPEKTVADKDGKDISKKVFTRGDGTIELFYSIKAYNPAEADKTFTITDKLNDAFTFVEASDEGTFDKETKTVTWSVDIEAGKDKTVTLKVTLPDNTTLSEVTNLAEVSADDYKGKTAESGKTGDPVVYITDRPVKNAVASSSSEQTTGSSSKAAATGKNMNNGLVLSGQTYSYTITWTNQTKEAHTYNVTDVLPDEVSFVEASDKGAEENGTVTWTNIPVAAGSSKTISVTVKVKSDLADKKINNKATVEFADKPELYTAKSNNVMTYIASITKTARPSEGGDNMYNDLVSAGEKFVYDIFVSNETGKDQTVTVTDDIPSSLTVSEASSNGKVSNQNVKWSNVTVPDGGLHLYVTVSVKANATDVSSSAITNTASMTTDNGGNATSNKAVVYAILAPTKKAEILTIGEKSKSTVGASSDSTLTAYSGDVVKYTIHQANPSGDARYFTITDTVDANLKIAEVGNGGKVNGQTITWKVYIAAGSAIDVTFTAAVPATDKALQISNTASVTTCNASAETNTVTLNIAAPEKEKAEDTADGVKPDNTGNPGNNSDASKTTEVSTKVTNRSTGDSSNMVLWISLAIAAAGTAAVIIYKKRRSAQ